MEWEDYEPNESDDIIDRVQRGERTPDEAERTARENGWPPFARRPDSAHFDPMREMRWTLVMAVGWILRRSGEAVRKVWTPYRTECHYWTLPQDWQVCDASGNGFKLYRNG